MNKIIIFFFVFSFLNAKEIKVVVSIAPLKAIIENITKDINPIVQLKSGNSPHNNLLSSKDLSLYLNADYYIATGFFNFENDTIDFISSNKIDVIKLNGNIETIEIEDEDHEHEEHHLKEDEHGHHHDGVDPHIWFSFLKLKEISNYIYNTLKMKGANFLDENKYKNFINKLDQYHKKYKNTLKNKKILVYHSAYNYLAQEFNLTVKDIEQEGDKPSIKYINQIINFAKENNIIKIYTQDEFKNKTVEVLSKELKASLIKIDVLSNDPIKSIIYMIESI